MQRLIGIVYCMRCAYAANSPLPWSIEIELAPGTLYAWPGRWSGSLRRHETLQPLAIVYTGWPQMRKCSFFEPSAIPFSASS